ncbi:MAG TPA: GNAT family N-acetyltransferase [Actinomycetota bacterium]|nr:GNAT family N-acetyltransferase [Actinomycetota bacterium]
MIRPLERRDADACDAIVAGLPDWFGNEDGIRQAAEAVRTHDGLVADESGQVVGFLTLVHPYPTTSEISWMAVRRDHHRTGVGRALVAGAVDHVAARGVRLLTVKTLSDREDPGPEYAQTRAFYLAVGFVPVAELDIWGPQNPCQLLARPV